MLRYAYIDESGTREYQKVMTVALVLLDGKRTAERIIDKLGALFHADHAKRSRRRNSTDLHYANLSRADRERLANELANARISAFVSYYWHDGKAAKHQQRFAIYASLVKETIQLALANSPQLSVTIAQQGGWRGYERAFESSLKLLEHNHTTGSETYRKLEIDLQPARRPGVQLADFYAGACREYLLDPDCPTTGTPFRSIKHQVELHLSRFDLIEKG
jgi:hypothetical protein